MCNLHIWLITLVSFALLFLIGLLVALKANLQDVTKLEPIDDIPDLTSYSRSGILMFAAIRKYRGHISIGYAFFTFLSIPILPIACYAYEEGANNRRSTNYRFYGKAKWSTIDVIYIYLINYGAIGCVVSIIGLVVELS